MRFNKPCLGCGELSPESYCPTCDAERKGIKESDPTRVAKKRYLYGPNYRRQRQAAKKQINVCHLCGQGEIPGDTWEADHLYPELGDSSPIAIAHRSCNQKRGNKPLEQT